MRRQIKKAVYKILQEDIYARQDDNYLIMRVVQELEPDLAGTSFSYVMRNLNYKGISLEGITRARRKFFEENPQLKIKKVEEYFLEYANHYTID